MPTLNEKPIRNASGGIAGVRVAHLEDWSEAFAAIGATELADRLAATVDRHEHLTAAAEDADAAVKVARADLARAIAAGELEPLKAAAELDKVEKRAALTGPAKALTDDARRTLIRDEVNRLRAAGDALVTDVLAPAVHAAADRLMVAAATLPAEGTADAAIAAGQADAWRTATAAVATIETCWNLAHRLRKAGILWTLRPPAVPARHWQWLEPPAKNPDTLAAWAAAIGEDRTPTVLTAAQVLELQLAPPTDREVNAAHVHAAYVANAGRTGRVVA